MRELEKTFKTALMRKLRERVATFFRWAPADQHAASIPDVVIAGPDIPVTWTELKVDRAVPTLQQRLTLNTLNTPPHSRSLVARRIGGREIEIFYPPFELQARWPKPDQVLDNIDALVRLLLGERP